MNVPSEVERTENIGKLPKWAERRIETLEANVEHWKRKATAGPDNSDTFADPYGEPPKPLGEETTIQFGRDRLGCIQVRLEKDTDTEVAISVRAMDIVSIYPEASNSFRVVARKRH